MKTLKRAMALIFVFALCINNYAAIVSDNDGSAFVTKAEFEALKNNFAKQITNYENSLTGKIDGAIASYLAGLQVNKSQALNAYIDADGKYNKEFYLYWSSATNGVAVDQTAHNKIALDHCFRHLTHNYENDVWQNGIYYWDNVYDEDEQADALVQKVMKKTKAKDKDGNEVECLKFEDVENKMIVNMWFIFLKQKVEANDPTTAVTGWQLTNLINLNYANLNQQYLKDNTLTYMRRDGNDASGVLKTCYLTLTQEETDSDYQTVFPFSTVVEKIWDEDDETTLLGKTGESCNLTPKAGVAEVSFTYASTLHELTDYYYVSMYQHKNYFANWQKQDDTIAVKNRINYSLIKADNRNKEQKYGVILATTPDNNAEKDLEIVVSSDEAGTFYAYIGDTPVDNWTDASFTGKSISLTANVKKTLKYEDVEKNKPIWVLFRPTDTTKLATLFVKECSIKNK